MIDDTRRTERILGISVLGLLILGCLAVLWPFVSAILWAMVLSFSTWPVYRRLLGFVRGRRILASLLMTLLISVVVLLPFVIAGLALADDVRALAAATRKLLGEGPPPPPAWLSSIPLIGDAAAEYWAELITDTAKFRQEAQRFIEPVSSWALGTGIKLGRGILELGLSVLVAFFLFRDGPALITRIRAAAERLAGTRGARLLEVASKTVRAVVYGVLGTALVQGMVAGTGFFIAGIPGPLLLALLTFFLSAVTPFGPPLVWIPASLWLFQRGLVGWGLFMVIWGMMVSTIDNLVRPLLISQEIDLPFIFVFLGVLGGLLAFGFIGIFLGPTLLAVGYKLVEEWITTRAEAAAAAEQRD
ncbi:MAG: AI-2E family transporter [Planctomycetes bacterium]|jgi:predicted PurR-regulated permease PerM|nr:AI-2E family transporter [Planctomycetota bacterium]